jgi:hypothetical protein
MARKTIDVEQVKAKANKALNDPTARYWQESTYGPHGAQAYRQGVIAVLETVLMDTGNYKGYSEHRDLADATQRTYL